MADSLEGRAAIPAVGTTPPEVQAAATTSLVLEIVFGFFSLLGVGHVYSGREALGVGLMVGWWLYLGFTAVITSLTAGIAACVLVPIYIAVPIISGIQASAYVKKAGATGSWKSVGIVAGAGCFIVVVTICLLSVFGVLTFGALGSLIGAQQNR